MKSAYVNFEDISDTSVFAAGTVKVNIKGLLSMAEKKTPIYVNVVGFNR